MIVACLAIVDLCVALLAARARMDAAELAHAAPVRLPPAVWSALPIACAVAIPAAVVAGVVLARRRGALRPLLELLVYHPVVLGAIWLAAPVAGSRPPVAALAAVAALAVFLLVVAAREASHPPADRRVPFAVAARALALPTALMLAAVVVVALVGGFERDGRALGVGLATYPLYALAQMLLLLVLPLSRLVRLTGSRAVAVGGCATLFALVHWPNPVVMVACLAGMTVWAAAYLRHGDVRAIAISMGIAAAAFAQLLPNDLTQHLRIGPTYVRALAVADLAARPVLGGRNPATRPFVAALYPAVVGRRADAAELDRWERDVAAGRRARTAWQMLAGRERRRLHPDDTAPEAAHWSDLPPAWRRRILAFAADDYLAAHGGDWPGFLHGLYRDVLEREGSAAEVAAWKETLVRTQRERIVEVMLARRRRLAREPFAGIGVEKLALP